MDEISYKDSGVDIDLGDLASKMLYDVAKKTWNNRKNDIGEIVVPYDDFSGLRAVNIGSLPKDTYMGIGFDGVGTKVEVAERVGDFSTLAYDLIAMVCDDAIVKGAEPVLVGSVLDINKLSGDLDVIKQLCDGYEKAANEANVAIMNGELAELGNHVGGYGDNRLSWSAATVWFGSKEKMFTGDEIKPGMKIVSLEEPGFRSNGFSLARKILENKYGEEWHKQEWNGKKLGRELLLPSVIYSKFIVKLRGGLFNKELCNISGVCHITGGGIPGKLGRTLKKSGCGARLDNLFNPPELMKHLIDIGNLDVKEAYRSWCMGQGLFVISDEPEVINSFAKEFGIKSKTCGEVTDTGNIEIINNDTSILFN